MGVHVDISVRPLGVDEAIIRGLCAHQGTWCAHVNTLGAITILVLAAIVVWGLVVLLSNPLVQGILALVAVGGLFLLLNRSSKE